MFWNNKNNLISIILRVFASDKFDFYDNFKLNKEKLQKKKKKWHIRKYLENTNLC